MSEPTAFSTRAAHAGRGAPPESRSRPLTPPIYQSSVYTFDRLEDLDMVTPAAKGYSYYRYGTPTHTALEDAMCTLEGAEAAITAASGLAIITAAILAVAGNGDRLVADRHTYGGTSTLLTAELPRLGIATTLVDATDTGEVRRALAAGPAPKALLIEALTNPTMRVCDVPALCALGREHGVPVFVDATFASPALFRPIAHGATLSWHSVAKYLGGHSAATGGIASGERTLIDAIRVKMIHLGGVLGALDAWMTLMGLPTLPLRMPVHSRNGQAIAEFLAGHPAVAAVHYPGLPGHPGHALARTLYPHGVGGMLAFDLRGGQAAVAPLIEHLRLIAFAPSLADVTTTLSYPVATSHSGLPDDTLRALGVGPGLVRLSAGIEDTADLVADLDQALSR
ncbi:MAG: trans-sulfuration enzyme family protein [Ktedonobacterales bacterium]